MLMWRSPWPMINKAVATTISSTPPPGPAQNAEPQTIFNGRSLPLVAVPWPWAMGLKPVRYEKRDPDDCAAIIRLDSAQRGIIRWTVASLEQWISDRCWPMPIEYSSYQPPQQKAQLHQRIQDAIARAFPPSPHGARMTSSTPQRTTSETVVFIIGGSLPTSSHRHQTSLLPHPCLRFVSPVASSATSVLFSQTSDPRSRFRPYNKMLSFSLYNVFPLFHLIAFHLITDNDHCDTCTCNLSYCSAVMDISTLSVSTKLIHTINQNEISGVPSVSYGGVIIISFSDRTGMVLEVGR